MILIPLFISTASLFIQSSHGESLPPQSGIDNDFMCPKYACWPTDECNKNAAYMKIYCQKSCGTIGCTESMMVDGMRGGVCEAKVDKDMCRALRRVAALKHAKDSMEMSSGGTGYGTPDSRPDPPPASPPQFPPIPDGPPFVNPDPDPPPTGPGGGPDLMPGYPSGQPPTSPQMPGRTPEPPTWTPTGGQPIPPSRPGPPPTGWPGQYPSPSGPAPSPPTGTWPAPSPPTATWPAPSPPTGTWPAPSPPTRTWPAPPPSGPSPPTGGGWPGPGPMAPGPGPMKPPTMNPGPGPMRPGPGPMNPGPGRSGGKGYGTGMKPIAPPPPPPYGGDGTMEYLPQDPHRVIRKRVVIRKTFKGRKASLKRSLPRCRNTNKQCDKWSKKGECKVNPRFMLVNCQKSCKAVGFSIDCQ